MGWRDTRGDKAPFNDAVIHLGKVVPSTGGPCMGSFPQQERRGRVLPNLIASGVCVVGSTYVVLVVDECVCSRYDMCQSVCGCSVSSAAAMLLV